MEIVHHWGIECRHKNGWSGNEYGALIIINNIALVLKNKNNAISIYRENVCNHQSQRNIVNVGIESAKRNYGPNFNHVNTFSLTITKFKSHFLRIMCGLRPESIETKLGERRKTKLHFVYCAQKHTLIRTHTCIYSVI